MAPSSSDKENKYNKWTLDEIKSECKKRKLKINESDTKDDLISLLIKDDNKSPDWGKIYSRVLYHTGMGYEEMARRTIPQIMAILDGAEENIPIKMGVPNIFGSPTLSATSTNEPKTDSPPKLSQFMSFANAFNGI